MLTQTCQHKESWRNPLQGGCGTLVLFCMSDCSPQPVCTTSWEAESDPGRLSHTCGWDLPEISNYCCNQYPINTSRAVRPLAVPLSEGCPPPECKLYGPTRTFTHTNLLCARHKLPGPWHRLLPTLYTLQSIPSHCPPPRSSLSKPR